ncbi:MAG TPA: sigma-70 family RNA polymerase sigma factor [Verrucomicrobiae bacterium]|nr:sigma-70 family RNA polymerase sigma factor [Verrucomicrobiae bacterium]
MRAGETEEEVRRLVEEDDPRAMEVLYDVFGESLHGFLVARLRDLHEAEDVLQQLFLDLARRPGRLLAARRLGPWLFAKARNLAIDRIRARGRTERREADWPSWLEPAVPARDAPSYDLALLAGMLDRLPAEQREVISLKVLQGRTFAEVGELLGVSINTAASRYRYAVEKLRGWLVAEEEHEA